MFLTYQQYSQFWDVFVFEKSRKNFQKRELNSDFFIFYILYPFWPKVWRNRAPKWIIEIGVEELGRAEYSYLTKQPHQFEITLEHHSHASNLNNKYNFLLPRWRVASVKTVSRRIDFVGKFFAELNAYFFAIILHFIFTPFIKEIFEKLFLALKKKLVDSQFFKNCWGFTRF